MQLNSDALGLALKATLLPDILFGNSWKYVNSSSIDYSVLLDDIMPGFAQAGYLKIMHTSSAIDEDTEKINFEQAFKKIADPYALLKEGFVGFPIIYSQYSLTFSEKINALSAFNELEYLVSTGSNPRQATLAGFILPQNVILNQLNPTDKIIDIARSTGNEALRTGAHAWGSQINDMANTPPPDPTPLIKLYNDKMKIYKSIKSGKRLLIYGPGGLLVEGQAAGLEISANADMPVVLRFSMNIIVTKIWAAETKFKYNTTG